MYDQARIHRLANDARHTEEGFEALLVALRPMLWRQLKQVFESYGLTRDDFMQEARIGVWYAVLDWDGERPFAPFAWLCVERNVITALKTASRQKHLPVWESLRFEHTYADAGDSDGEVLADLVPCRQPSPHEQVELAGEAREVLAGIAELTPLERGAVELVVLQGRDYDEASRALGGSNVKTIDNALQRSRRKLARAA